MGLKCRLIKVGPCIQLLGFVLLRMKVIIKSITEIYLKFSRPTKPTGKAHKWESPDAFHFTFLLLLTFVGRKIFPSVLQSHVSGFRKQGANKQKKDM
jgi:hypothetical protein